MSKKRKHNKSGIRALIIGDIHFKPKNIREGEIFVKRVLKVVQKEKPTFVVILGDTLDTHENVKTPAFNLACDFIDELTELSHVYLIIGNHDLINNRQFLTTNHPFNNLKKWKNITVVDKVVHDTFGEYSFTFCPYVEPGKFQDALDTVLASGVIWEFTNCIFAHQEFYGCKMGAITSEIGDKWDEDYPPVISGHIHDEQIVGKNIFYTGSAIQHAFGESSNKRIWLVTFDENSKEITTSQYGSYFNVKKINLKMRGKKIIYLPVDEIEKFGQEKIQKMSKRNDIKLSLKGTTEQFHVFRNKKVYNDLRQIGIKFAYKPQLENDQDEESKDQKKSREQVSFLGILERLIKKRGQKVANVYENITGRKVLSPKSITNSPVLEVSLSNENSDYDDELSDWSDNKVELTFDSDSTNNTSSDEEDLHNSENGKVSSSESND